MTLLLYLFYDAMAVLFFSIVQHAPRKALIATPIVGMAGYAVFHILNYDLDSTLSAYFASALVIALLSELFARRFRMPSVIFVTPALIPIVPGRGLFNTILQITQEDYEVALKIGTETMISLSAIAMAIALSTVIIRVSTYIFSRKEVVDE